MGGVKSYHDTQCDAGCLLQIITWEPVLDAKKLVGTGIDRDFMHDV